MLSPGAVTWARPCPCGAASGLDISCIAAPAYNTTRVSISQRRWPAQVTAAAAGISDAAEFRPGVFGQGRLWTAAFLAVVGVGCLSNKKGAGSPRCCRVSHAACWCGSPWGTRPMPMCVCFRPASPSVLLSPSPIPPSLQQLCWGFPINPLVLGSLLDPPYFFCHYSVI